MLNIIAFDADDTLWHNESLYQHTQARLQGLLTGYVTEETVSERLYQIESRNLEYYGYGIKSFTLSMIETAIEVTEGKITGGDIQKILDFAKEMLATPIQLLDHVEEIVSALASTYRLMIITKGDLFDQETKIARSGLADFFTHIEIVSEKTADTYQALLDKHNIDPKHFLMVGNSVKSDILPVVAIGGQAVHIPYHTTWQHEVVDSAHLVAQNGYYELEDLEQLPRLLEQIATGL